MNQPVDPKRRALGRGLDALLPSAPAPRADYGDKSVFLCPVEKIAPQAGQPRQVFDEIALDELAASLKEHGLLEPLVVRRKGTTDSFELIAGERRWRAAQRAGMHDVLVVVKDVTPEKAFVLAILENVQREDLNPMELAEAYQRLVKEHGYTQEALAERLGKSRVAITNVLRLLKLPERFRTRVMQGELTEGHARALLGAPEEKLDGIAEKVLRGRLNVRATEDLVRKAKDDPKPSKGKPKEDSAAPGEKSPSIKDLERRLMVALGTRVEVRDSGNKGELAIAYADLDVLDRVLAKILK
jgi:ParB family chromosome partitioning protein